MWHEYVLFESIKVYFLFMYKKEIRMKIFNIGTQISKGIGVHNILEKIK